MDVHCLCPLKPLMLKSPVWLSSESTAHAAGRFPSRARMPATVRSRSTRNARAGTRPGAQKTPEIAQTESAENSRGEATRKCTDDFWCGPEHPYHVSSIARFRIMDGGCLPVRIRDAAFVDFPLELLLISQPRSTDLKIHYASLVVVVP